VIEPSVLSYLGMKIKMDILDYKNSHLIWNQSNKFMLLSSDLLIVLLLILMEVYRGHLFTVKCLLKEQLNQFIKV